MFKQDLIFQKPIMNAAGMLGFSPDLRAPVTWDDFGAFITNPLSLRPRKAANQPAAIEYPGGFLLHSGLPNRDSIPLSINMHAVGPIPHCQSL